VIVAPFALACVASDTSASAFRRLAPSVVRFVSDGARYAAWEASEGAPVVMFDTMTGRRSVFALPRGCGLADGHVGYGWPAAAGRFLLACTNREPLMLAAATERITILPRNTGAHENLWGGGIGSRYVEGVATPPACRESPSEVKRRLVCIALYNLATGVVSYRPHSQVADLDQKGLPRSARSFAAKCLRNKNEEANLTTMMASLLRPFTTMEI
jgi:hypothetical protein